MSEKLNEAGDTLKKVQNFDEVLSAPSGGTIETMFHSFNLQKKKSKLGYDPLFKLNGSQERSEYKIKNRLPRFLGYSSLKKCFTLPFAMAMVNVEIVKRSNALLGYAKDFSYEEYAI